MWTGGLWVCPEGLHSRAYTMHSLTERVRTLMDTLGYRRWTAEALVHKQRRICWWHEWNHRMERQKRRVAAALSGERRRQSEPP